MILFQNTAVKTDFLFRVTELEFEVINLDFNSPILLMGRSGTGKTVCCLYRQWTQFLKYWTEAKRDGYKPWLSWKMVSVPVADDGMKFLSFACIGYVAWLYMYTLWFRMGVCLHFSFCFISFIIIIIIMPLTGNMEFCALHAKTPLMPKTLKLIYQGFKTYIYTDMYTEITIVAY